MANPKQVKILKQGVEVWNDWRYKHHRGEIDRVRGGDIDLSRADFSGVDLGGADFSKANLKGLFFLHIVNTHHYVRAKSGMVILDVWRKMGYIK